MIRTAIAVAVALAALGVLAAQSDQDVTVALYRTSLIDNTSRERVAIFDGQQATPGAELKYNEAHCELVVRALEELGAPRGYWWCAP
jgi:hypothetical protein